MLVQMLEQCLIIVWIFKAISKMCMCCMCPMYFVTIYKSSDPKTSISNFIPPIAIIMAPLQCIAYTCEDAANGSCVVVVHDTLASSLCGVR